MLAKAGEGDRVIRTKMVRIPFFIVIGFLIYILPHSQNIYLLANGRAERHKDDDCTCTSIIFSFFLRLYSDLIVHVNFFFFLWQYYHSSFIHLSTWGLRTTKKKKPKKSPKIEVQFQSILQQHQ